jgi:hypothetical protein
MTLRAEIAETIATIEERSRDMLALATRVHRIAKTATPEERRALHNALREAREGHAAAHATMLAEVV